MKAKVSKQEVIAKLKIDNDRTTDISHINTSGSYELNVAPSPVEVPRMFDDWLEGYVEDISEINDGIYEFVSQFGENELPKELQKWSENDNNYNLAIRAIIYGYKVKTETKWYVRVPNSAVGYYYKNGNDLDVFSTRNGRTLQSRAEFSQEELKQYHLDGDSLERIEVK